jgi:hypothetical protein
MWRGRVAREDEGGGSSGTGLLAAAVVDAGFSFGMPPAKNLPSCGVSRLQGGG